MAVAKYTNNAQTKLAVALTIGGTSMTVSAGDGALFPTLTGGDWFWATLTKDDGIGASKEVVKVTARAADVFTIVRAQDNSAALAFAIGDFVELRWIAASVADLVAQIVAAAAAAAAALPKAGGTMTGPLVLAADPTAPLQSATKQYVDGQLVKAGQILQTKWFLDDATVSHASGSYQIVSGALFSFTPKSTNSTLIIEAHGQFAMRAAGAGEFYTLYAIYDNVTAAQLAFTQYTEDFTGLSTNTVPGSLMAIKANTSLAVLQLFLAAATVCLSCTCYNIRWRVTEIQN